MATTSDSSRGWFSSFGPLRRRGFLLVWTAGLISMAGDWMLRITLPILVFELTGSVTATSAVVIANGVPTLLFGSVAGVFVDRWDRRRVMVVTSLAQAIAVLPLMAVHDAGSVWIVYAVTFAVASLGQFFRPAEAALLPSLVEPDQLVAANSLNAVNNNLARLAGPAIGGIVAAWSGLAAVAVADTATFVAAVALLALVPGRHRAETAERDQAAITDAPEGRDRSGIHRAVRSVWRELVDGMALVRRSRVLLVLIATFTLTSVGEGLMGALFAVYVKEGLEGGVTEVGWLMSAQAVGGIVGRSVWRLVRCAVLARTPDRGGFGGVRLPRPGALRVSIGVDGVLAGGGIARPRRYPGRHLRIRGDGAHPGRGPRRVPRSGVRCDGHVHGSGRHGRRGSGCRVR